MNTYIFQTDTYILKQDEEHIPDHVKNDKADMDFLEIPADDAPQANVRPWPHTELPKVFFILKSPFRLLPSIPGGQSGDKNQI